MNTASASPAELPAGSGRPASAAEPAPGQSILVWDAPVRVFHWLMVLSFAGAWLTAESERWRLAHVTLGYTMAGLVAFRLVWGLMGTRHARFGAFVRGPAAVLRYLRSLRARQPEHHVGHNPAGALAIVAMLLLTVVIGATGWATYEDVSLPWPAKWMEELHEGAATLMLVVVVGHLLGVVTSSRLHAENLARAMLTGRKRGNPSEGIRGARRSLAAVMLMAVLGLWWLQWQGAPAGGAASGGHVAMQADGRPAAPAAAQLKRPHDHDADD